MQLLGVLRSLKGITSYSVASQCVLKLYEAGEIVVINKSETRELAQFGAHFITNTDQPQSCNFASFVPYGEETPLQVIKHSIRLMIYWEAKEELARAKEQ